MFIEVLKSIFLGIVEGITEWLPISSTGHLILVDEFIKLDVSAEFMKMYLYVIQLGAILAVVLLFFHKLNPFSPKKSPARKRQTWELWGKVVVACIPSAVIGLPLNDWVDEHLENPWVVSAALILYGLAFLWIENHPRTAAIRRVDDISWQTALFIGLFQVLAIVPGTSRSGATILGAILLSCSRSAAAEFSFFLAIPTMFGVSALKLGKFFVGKLAAKEALFTGGEIAILLTGFVVAFVVSVFCIRFLMEFVKKHDFKAFGWYRIVLGVVMLLTFGILAAFAAE